MKKIFALLCALFLTTHIFAANVNQLIFIGDSLSDNGNLYEILKIIPKSPPYYKGRFTNGITWAEHVGNYFYDKSYIDYHIYALGGATSIVHNPLTDSFVAPVTLTGELYAYLAKSLFIDKSKVLYTIWIGANDYLYEREPNIDTLSTNVVNNIAWAMNKLIDQGAQTFLILNLPDLSRTPYGKNAELKDRLHKMTEMHNQKLLAAVNAIREAHPNIKIISLDIYSIFNDMLNNIDKYNTKYHSSVHNVNDSCWRGGFTLRQNIQDQEFTLANAIRQSQMSDKDIHTNNMDTHAMANYILHSPALRETYATIQAYQNGVPPCANAEEYVFWDQIHPTETVHRVLGEMVIETLAQEGIHISN